MSNKFPKTDRLKSFKAFQILFEKGSTYKSYPIRMVFLPWENTQGQSLAGFSVSKKRFKRAVDRNRVKRLMRESYRLNKTAYLTELQQTYAVVFIYLSHQHRAYKEVDVAMKKCLNHLQKIDFENNGESKKTLKN